MPATSSPTAVHPPTFLGRLLETLTFRTVSGRAPRAGNEHPVSGGLETLAEELLSRRGEASGVVLARTLLDAYVAAPAADRLRFLEALARRFGPDRAAVCRAIERMQLAPDDPVALECLHATAEPRRQGLFRRLNLAPGGTRALVGLREELLALVAVHPGLKAVESDLVHLLASWFNRGFLVLSRIDWHTPATILEKIIRFEAVHAIEDWDDLRRRVEPSDRRCYGFFHPQLAEEPLIFVEVALSQTVPAAVGPLLDQRRKPIPATAATTAIFYSISNTQKGLEGISFGNFLIKQVVGDLQRELPNLRHFVTLSPIPGFASWLARERAAAKGSLAGAGPSGTLALLDTPGWHTDAAIVERVRPVLLAQAARYFLEAKNAAGRPVDPVARFHLGNGARLDRMNFLGDPSAKGLKQSHGLMVNYRYAPDEIETNHEAFAEKGTISAAPAIRRLARSRSDGTVKKAG